MPTSRTDRPSSRTSRASRRARAPDTGVTLVEMLVVLALIGIVAATAALGVRTGGNAAGRERDLLIARLEIASEDAVLSGRPVALRWDEAGYAFVVAEEGEWRPHLTPMLGERHDLPSGLRIGPDLSGGGSFAVGGDGWPVTGAALRLSIGASGDDPSMVPRIVWDGVGAYLEQPT